MGIATLERAHTIRQTQYAPARWLGTAFLAVILTSLVGGLLLGSAVESGDRADLLQHLSSRLTMARAGAVIDLITSCGIIALAVLLYTVLHRYGRTVALVALGRWMAEAMFMAISRLGALALSSLATASSTPVRRRSPPIRWWEMRSTKGSTRPPTRSICSSTASVGCSGTACSTDPTPFRT